MLGALWLSDTEPVFTGSGDSPSITNWTTLFNIDTS